MKGPKGHWRKWHYPELKILADFKILALQNPKFKILADVKFFAFHNPEFKILPDFKILAFQNPEFRKCGFLGDLAKIAITWSFGNF